MIGRIKTEVGLVGFDGLTDCFTLISDFSGKAWHRGANARLEYLRGNEPIVHETYGREGRDHSKDDHGFAWTHVAFEMLPYLEHTTGAG